MRCNDNYGPSSTCGHRTPAVCVRYNSDIPPYSKLNREDCHNLEEAIEDLYELITALRHKTDMTGYDPDCIEIDKKNTVYDRERSTYMIKDVLEGVTNKLCEIEEKLSVESDGGMELDFKCLKTECGNNITSLRDLMQVLINEICNLKNN